MKDFRVKKSEMRQSIVVAMVRSILGILAGNGYFKTGNLYEVVF